MVDKDTRNFVSLTSSYQRNMKKIVYPFLVLTAACLLASCKSKKNLTAFPVQVVSQAEPIVRDTVVNSNKLPEENPLLLEKTGKQKSEENKQSIPSQQSITAKKKNTKAIGDAKITYSTVNVSATCSAVDRVVKYEFTHCDVPEAFEGFRIAFISDLHYQSLLKEKGLDDLVRLLIAQKADVLLMGGDYQEGCEYVSPLFAALSRVNPPMGIYGVMGNNDYERCHDEILRTMNRYGMRVLEHQVDTIYKNKQRILIAGVRNPFDLTRNGKSPTLNLSPEDFVVLLVHTPDYVEQVSVVNTDLALAGHTHGGQVRMFGIAPVLNSHYGTRFLTGLAYNSAKVPIIVTNGIGTSKMPVRVGAPAEVVMITLHCLKE